MRTADYGRNGNINSNVKTINKRNQKNPAAVGEFRKITKETPAEKPETYSASRAISETPDKAMRVKLVVSAGLILLFAVYVLMKLYTVAVVQSEYYRERANHQQLADLPIMASRGTVFDRNGDILAKSKTVWNVVLSPRDAYYTERCHEAHNENCADPCLREVCKDCPREGCQKRIQRISKALAEALELEYEDVLEKCNRTRSSYVYLAKSVDKSVYDKITAIKRLQRIDEAVLLIDDAKRIYTNGRTAASLIGFTDYSHTGMYGVEAYYDEYLQGLDGRIVMRKDGNSRSMPNEFKRRFEPVNGSDVYMTIDLDLQRLLESELEKIVNQHNVANRALGIMMDPNTGAIFAMATSGGYDPNVPTELCEKDNQRLEGLKQRLEEAEIEPGLNYTGVCSDDNKCKGKELKNRCKQCTRKYEIEGEVNSVTRQLWEQQWKTKAITDTYYPGSVFKVVTAAMALEEKVVTVNSGFHCSGSAEVSGVRVNCWQTWGHGSVDNLQQALQHSCNPAFMNIASRLGKDKFYDYFEALGFTQKTGIDLLAETDSVTRTRENMTNLDLATSSFGQTNRISPMQMITGFAATINGGYLVTPHVVDRVVDGKGNVVKSASREPKRQVLSKETSDAMRQMLEEVVRGNGGGNAYIEGFSIGGKSGTSQKLDEYPEDDSMRYIASFCAFSPAGKDGIPQVIMLVAVDEPMGEQYYGSRVAAPVVSAVFREGLQYLGIFPELDAEARAQQDTHVPYILGREASAAEMALAARGLKFRKIGDGPKVVRTVPEHGTPIRQGSTVVMYFDNSDLRKAVVPDVVGMGVNAATKAITDAGLNIRLTGGSVNNANSVAVYMEIAPGTTLNEGAIVDVQFAVDEGHGG